MDRQDIRTYISKLLALLTLCSLSIFIPIKNANAYTESFVLSVDKYYSPYMGADLMIAGMRGYQAVDDIVASGTVCNTSQSMTLIRSAKWLLEFTLSNFAMVLQHEIFGHGARLREFGIGDIGYHISFLHGETTFPYSSFVDLNNNQKAAYYGSGVDASSILATKIEKTWLINGEIDSREATMYLVNVLDSATYAFATSSNAFHPDDDANNYINYVNAWFAQNNALDTHKFKVAMAWNWLNPMIYISGISVLNYIWQGAMSCNYGTLHIGESRFMPTTRTLLAPYGPEYQLLVNLFTPNDQYIGLFLRYGHTHGKKSWGLDINIAPLAVYDCWSIENTISAWNQPHLLKPGNAATNTNKYGFADYLTVYYRLSRAVYAKGEIGYKLSGYQPGRQLSSGAYWNVGFKIDLAAPKHVPKL